MYILVHVTVHETCMYMYMYTHILHYDYIDILNTIVLTIYMCTSHNATLVVCVQSVV